ncbi:MAG: FAD-dependent oxidoreductase [Chloroflexota bacterium]
MIDTLIIGAGISGLLAATRLKSTGRSVLVLDKGRGVGGRMASRRMSDDGKTRADHGAQFFTVRDAQFERWVKQWLNSGVVEEWCRGFSGQDGHPRYRGAGGMTAVAKQLAAHLDVRTKTKVTAIQQKDETWQVLTEDGTAFACYNLIVTSPVPQSLTLLKVELPQADRTALEAISYHPCFAVMALLSAPSQMPAPGGIQVRGPVIDWIGDNHQKGISAETTVTIHGSPDFTRQHLNADRLEVGQMLIDVADRAGYFDKTAVESYQVHRWMYAQPINCYPKRCLNIPINGLPIVFAGDAFKHARVEGAALSGLAAAESLLATSQP